MKYDIIRERNPAAIVARTNEKIAEGWEPAGGIACSNYDELYQAIVWREPVVPTAPAADGKPTQTPKAGK